MAAVGASVFIWCTIALAFIDQETGYLFDNITLPLLWLGLLLNLGRTYVPVGDAVIGAAAGYLVLWSVYWLFKLVTGKDGMGYGDFKLNAAVGAFLGWQMLPLVILLSSIVGSIFGIAQMLAAKGGWEWNFRFHFGPYLAIAGIVALFWGPQLTRQYFSQFM
jgi:leader peptidase (prepilin peptidase)/N-methyltransferase